MKTLYVLDGYIFIYRAYFANMAAELTSSSGEPTGCTYLFMKMLFKILQEHKPDMLVVAMDSLGPTFRKKLFDSYKSSRPETMPDNMILQINRVIEILEIMDIPVFRVSTFEADDIIGTICKQAEPCFGIKTTICTRDKDVNQLIVDGKVDVLDPKTGFRTDAARVYEKWGVHPHQFIDFLALQGDSSDHVPGVPGIGPKGARTLLEDWGDGDTVYANLRHIKGAIGKKLRDRKDLYDMSRELVIIRTDVPIDLNTDDAIVRPFRWTRLNEIFSELGFTSLMQGRTSKGRKLF